MPLAIPPELKKIAPYVKRAEELDKDKTSPQSRLVAYYCRQYAVHVGIPLAGNDAGAKTCLGHLLSDLEKEKPAMDNFTRDEAAFLCRKFAEGIFNKADEEDRAGKANKATAKTFYAAASFLQILEQFAGDNDESVEEDKKRIVYAKWKATEILKALKEGRQPTPGGYGEDEEQQEETQSDDDETKETPTAVETVHEESDEEEEPGDAKMNDDDFGLPPVPSTALKPPTTMQQPTVPPTQQQQSDNDDDDDDDEEEEVGTEVELGPPPAYPADSGGDDDQPMSDPSSASRVDRPTLSFELPTAPDPILPTPVAAPPPPPKKKSSTGGVFGGFGKKKKTGGAVSKAAMKDAMELTRFAMAALEDKDANLAAERLQQALSALGR